MDEPLPPAGAPYAFVYVIVRFDAYVTGSPPETAFRVKGAVRTRAEAEAEVERLNALNAEKGSRYFWQRTRLARASNEPNEEVGG